jgi:hypothetical protein
LGDCLFDDDNLFLRDDILVLFGVALGVAHIPSQGIKKGIDELDACLGLFVLAAFRASRLPAKRSTWVLASS